MSTIETNIAAFVDHGLMTRETAAADLARITTTTDYDAAVDADHVIEAVPAVRELQREVFVLSLADELEQAPELAGFRTGLLDDGELEVEMGPSQNLNDLFQALDSRGIKVVSLRNKANRLEELFMRLVESKQRDDREVESA